MSMAGDSVKDGPVSMVVEFGGRSLSVQGAPGITQEVLSLGVKSLPFQQWLENLTSERGLLTLRTAEGKEKVAVEKVLVQSVDMFGPRVGFVKFKADVRDIAAGALMPGIVFGRGAAVGILIILESLGEHLVVLVEQVRVPVGRKVLELPAGMLDADKGDFVGTAAREVAEETGLKFNVADLVDLTALLEPHTGQHMLPSPGACDEVLGLFLYRGTIDYEMAEKLKGKETGLRDDGELIELHVIPYSQLWKFTADAKALSAIAIFENACREGILSPAPNLPQWNAPAYLRPLQDAPCTA